MRANEIQVLINWGDTDKAGIVYYPNYFKWFDIAGHHFFRSCHLSPSKLEQERNIILPILDARCSFEKVLYYDDIITIVTRVEEITTRSIKLRHEVFRGEVKTGHGYEIRGWVEQHGDEVRAVPIPEDVKTNLKQDVHLKAKGPLFNA